MFKTAVSNLTGVKIWAAQRFTSKSLIQCHLKAIVYNLWRFWTWCSLTVLVHRVLIFSCCGLFTLLVHLLNGDRQTHQDILVVLLPGNDRFFSSYAISSCLELSAFIFKPIYREWYLRLCCCTVRRHSE